MSRAITSLVNHLIDVLAALFFFMVIVPCVWIWERGRRPMWRTLTPQQTRELRAWLNHRQKV